MNGYFKFLLTVLFPLLSTRKSMGFLRNGAIKRFHYLWIIFNREIFKQISGRRRANSSINRTNQVYPNGDTANRNPCKIGKWPNARNSRARGCGIYQLTQFKPREQAHGVLKTFFTSPAAPYTIDKAPFEATRSGSTTKMCRLLFCRYPRELACSGNGIATAASSIFREQRCFRVHLLSPQRRAVCLSDEE